MQLKLFQPTVLLHAELESDSPKKAFWNIRLEYENGAYAVIKESGSAGRVLDARRWPHADYEAAMADYNRRLKQKLRPGRRSPRIYKKRG